MDKTTKFILGLIAVALIGINIQMWNGKLIKDAKADTGVQKIAICDTRGNCAGPVIEMKGSTRKWFPVADQFRVRK